MGYNFFHLATPYTCTWVKHFLECLYISLCIPLGFKGHHLPLCGRQAPYPSGRGRFDMVRPSSTCLCTISQLSPNQLRLFALSPLITTLSHLTHNPLPHSDTIAMHHGLARVCAPLKEVLLFIGQLLGRALAIYFKSGCFITGSWRMNPTLNTN